MAFLPLPEVGSKATSVLNEVYTFWKENYEEEVEFGEEGAGYRQFSDTFLGTSGCPMFE